MYLDKTLGLLFRESPIPVGGVCFFCEVYVFLSDTRGINVDCGAEDGFGRSMGVLFDLRQLQLRILRPCSSDDIVVQDKDGTDDAEDERAEIQRDFGSYFYEKWRIRV